MNDLEFNELIQVINYTTELKLAKESLTLSQVNILAKALSNNRIITAINLSENQIGPKGAKILADALRFNHNIRILNL